MSTSTIITKGRKFSTAVCNTVTELAIDIAQDIWDTFGDDLTKDNAQDIGDGIGGDVGARVSEWKAFAMAVPFGMVEALRAYPKGELTRIDMFRLARAVNKAGDYTRVKETVAAFVEARDSKKTSKGRAPTIGMGLGIIKNLQTRSRKVIAFRKELAQLCQKYGITY